MGHNFYYKVNPYIFMNTSTVLYFRNNLIFKRDIAEPDNEGVVRMHTGFVEDQQLI